MIMEGPCSSHGPQVIAVAGYASGAFRSSIRALVKRNSQPPPRLEFVLARMLLTEAAFLCTSRRTPTNSAAGCFPDWPAGMLVTGATGTVAGQQKTSCCVRAIWEAKHES